MVAAAEQCCLPISEISAYVQRWTIRARVTSKSTLRTFNKGPNGGGKVFHVHLLDVYGGEIRASFFNEAVDKHFDLLQLGNCYTLSRGSVKIADQRYNPCSHRYELVFDKMAQIEEVDDDEHIEAVKLSLTDLRSIQTRQLPFSADICGILSNAGPCIAFTSKEGRELVKRELTVVDDTATSITVTLWGDRAKQEDKLFEGNPVVGLKGVMVKEWNSGRSGSLSESGTLVFSPKIADAERVQRWWADGGKTQSITALTVVGGGAGGAGGSRAANAKSMDLAEMRKRSELLLDQPELYSVVCRLAMVQTQKRGEAQPLYYTACQETRESKAPGLPGMACQRKVDSSGFCAACNRAGKAAPRFNLRCRFSDFADNAWLTTFHDAAQQVVGLSAEQAKDMELAEGGREMLEAAINARYFRQPMKLTLRAKLDSYNGETKTNISCIDARPVPRGDRGRAMLQEIREKLMAGGQERF